MSMENVRRHWKSLAAVALVFVLVALAGPLVFYGVPVLFAWMMSTNPVLLLFAFPVLVVGWFFGSLWLGWKANEFPVAGDEADLTNEGSHG